MSTFVSFFILWTTWVMWLQGERCMRPTLVSRKRFIYPIRKVLFLDESGHEPQLRAVHADGATAKSAKMGGEARPSGSGVGLMHRLPFHKCGGSCTAYITGRPRRGEYPTVVDRDSRWFPII